MIAAAAQRNKTSHMFVVVNNTKMSSVAARRINISAGKGILFPPLFLQHVVDKITDPAH